MTNSLTLASETSAAKMDANRQLSNRRRAMASSNRAISSPAASFEFGRDVIRGFDDMVSRSVPLYETIQQLIAALVLRCRAVGPIYDLGCSTGATFKAPIERAATPQPRATPFARRKSGSYIRPTAIAAPEPDRVCRCGARADAVRLDVSDAYRDQKPHEDHSNSPTSNGKRRMRST
jgi:hypothetical protein